MTQALRVVSVERGHDPAGAALIAFGGAGPLHACELAAQLGATQVLCLPASGVLSAVGLAAAERRRDASRSLLRPLAEVEALDRRVAELAAAEDGRGGARRGRPALRRPVVRAADPVRRPRRARRRLPRRARAPLRPRRPGRAVELVTLRAAAVRPGAEVRLTAGGDVERSRRTIRWDGEDVDAEVLSGTGLPPGTTSKARRSWSSRRRPASSRPAGPARPTSRTCGWSARERRRAPGRGRLAARDRGGDGHRADPQRASPNIKERRDCSTALFDADGRLVIQAEHIPVHLGALRPRSRPCAHTTSRPATCGAQRPFLAARTCRTSRSSRRSTSPASGSAGRVARPPRRRRRMVPASMPADSTELHQEGLILPPMRGSSGELIDLIAANSRAGDERRGDLRAQLAVHRLAERRVEERARAAAADWWRAACAEVGTTPSGAPRRDRGDARRALRGDRDGRGGRGRPRDPRGGRDRRRRGARRLRRHGPQHGGNLNCRSR